MGSTSSSCHVPAFATVVLALLLLASGHAYARTQAVANGDFETGDLAGWTGSGINGGFANTVQEGTCFSGNNTLGLTFSGDFAARLRSGQPPTSTSIGILTSDPFTAGLNVSFAALSERGSARPQDVDPVAFEVQLLDSAGDVLVSQVVPTNIVALDPGGNPVLSPCQFGSLIDGAFSSHTLDTSSFTGQTVSLRFTQHTNVDNQGYFTLVDDVSVSPDEDLDGYAPPDDCDDSDPDLNPGAPELPGNFVDENCDGNLGECDPCLDWKNHGQYVRCVAHAVEDLVLAEILTEDEGDTLVTSGAQSSIGKKGFEPPECQP